MSDITRRRALTHLARAFVVAGTIDRRHAVAAHQMIRQAASAGPYGPRALTAQPFRTLECLTDLILPVDQGSVGALGAGVPAWIDTLLNVNAELKSRYVTGLAWLDTSTRATHGTDFADAAPAQQTSLLDTIAFRKNRTSETEIGVDFFILARRMTVDGFYTSPVGMGQVYVGNLGKNEYIVPNDAVDYVLSRSPFA